MSSGLNSWKLSVSPSKIEGLALEQVASLVWAWTSNDALQVVGGPQPLVGVPDARGKRITRISIRRLSMATSKDEFDPGDSVIIQAMRVVVLPAVEFMAKGYPPLAPSACDVWVWVRGESRHVIGLGIEPDKSPETPVVKVHLRFRKTIEPTRVQYIFGTVRKHHLVTLSSEWCGMFGRGVLRLVDGCWQSSPFHSVCEDLWSGERFWSGVEAEPLWFTRPTGG